MDYTSFLDSFFEQIKKLNLDVSGLSLDHVAYQASTPDNYNKVFQEFHELGLFVSEEMIGGRRVAIFKLQEPIEYKSYRIPVLELIEPKTGQSCKSELQHAEFVVNQPFTKYIEQYPNITWDTSSMNRERIPHLKLNFPNGLTLKFVLRPIIEEMSRDYMLLAFEEAKLAKANGDWPFGAVVVKNGKVVGKGHVFDKTGGDVTDHAELVALRDACRNLKANDLSGCSIYCSNEPCMMCAAGIFQAGIAEVYIGVSRDDLPHLLRPRLLRIEDLAKDSGHPISIYRGILKEKILPLFSDIKK